jgi:hypothetical protein
MGRVEFWNKTSYCFFLNREKERKREREKEREREGGREEKMVICGCFSF